MTTTFLFWGYFAGFALVALFVGILSARVRGLERRIDQLRDPHDRA